jgi:hypothetical protein
MSLDNQSVPGDPDRLTMDQLAPELQTSIGETFGYPVVQLILDNDYAGSGILVEVDGVFGILTAEHVVFNPRKALMSGQILATIPAIYPIERINDSSIKPDVVGIPVAVLDWYPPGPHSEDYVDAEWGPDLAFIYIPKNTEFQSRLRIRRNYSDLTYAPESRMHRALDQNNTLVAIVGAPGNGSTSILYLGMAKSSSVLSAAYF